MDPASVEQILTIMRISGIASMVLLRLVGIAGVVGAVMAATTRPDAYDAAGRQSKMAWAAILGVSAVACLLPLPLVSWFGAVAIGIYFFDVRPQIQNILNGNYGW